MQYNLSHLWTEIMTSQPLFQNTFVLRRLRVAIFADIIKIVTMFFKTIFKVSRIIKRIRNYVPKCNLYLYLLILQNLLISGEKTLMSAELNGVCPVIYKYIWIFFRSGITAPSFTIGGYV